jgi:hypothetical protein
MDYCQTQLNKNFLDSSNKTFSTDVNLKVSDKLKCIKVIKCRDREKKVDITTDSYNKKKYKFRNS